MSDIVSSRWLCSNPLKNDISLHEFSSMKNNSSMVHEKMEPEKLQIAFFSSHFFLLASTTTQHILVCGLSLFR